MLLGRHGGGAKLQWRLHVGGVGWIEGSPVSMAMPNDAMPRAYR